MGIKIDVWDLVKLRKGVFLDKQKASNGRDKWIKVIMRPFNRFSKVTIDNIPDYGWHEETANDTMLPGVAKKVLIITNINGEKGVFGKIEKELAEDIEKITEEKEMLELERGTDAGLIEKLSGDAAEKTAQVRRIVPSKKKKDDVPDFSKKGNLSSGYSENEEEGG